VTDVLSFLSNVPLSVWLAVSGALSGVAAWIVSVWKIYASIERARIKMTADAAIGEGAERAAFRASLLAELTDLRAMLKKCDDDKDALRMRANSAEGQIAVLKSSNEIMERWVAFFKERNAPEFGPTHQSP
jgi:hypothetical protein